MGLAYNMISRFDSKTR